MPLKTVSRILMDACEGSDSHGETRDECMRNMTCCCRKCSTHLCNVCDFFNQLSVNHTHLVLLLPRMERFAKPMCFSHGAIDAIRTKPEHNNRVNRHWDECVAIRYSSNLLCFALVRSAASLLQGSHCNAFPFISCNLLYHLHGTHYMIILPPVSTSPGTIQLLCSF